ncbi:hypothetical protein J6590_042496 [Homalodisca vitripennis]|nr:hypothetical protein J6590_042496 [Homalodisca vitripennis]
MESRAHFSYAKGKEEKNTKTKACETEDLYREDRVEVTGGGGRYCQILSALSSATILHFLLVTSVNIGCAMAAAALLGWNGTSGSNRHHSIGKSTERELRHPPRVQGATNPATTTILARVQGATTPATTTMSCYTNLTICMFQTGSGSRSNHPGNHHNVLLHKPDHILARVQGATTPATTTMSCYTNLTICMFQTGSGSRSNHPGNHHNVLLHKPDHMYVSDWLGFKEQPPRQPPQCLVTQT